MKSLWKDVKLRLSHFGNKGDLYECVTVIKDGDNSGVERKVAPSDMFRSLVEFNNIVKRHAQTVLSDYFIDWPPESLTLPEILGGSHPDQYRQCQVAGSLAYRINGKWALETRVGNVSSDIVVRPWRRAFFAEAVYLNEKKQVVPLTFVVPTCRAIPGEPWNMNLGGYKRGTARVATWEGRTTWKHFGSGELWKNPAVEEALLCAEHGKDIVEDSETISNLAILILPATLAFFPIGAFQDVSTRALLGFALVSDVLNIVPLIIKGFEMIHHGSKSHTAMVSFLHGGSNATDLALAETWAARCTLKPKVKIMGRTIVAGGFMFLIVGIIADYFSRNIYRDEEAKRKLEMMTAQDGRMRLIREGKTDETVADQLEWPQEDCTV